jgi:hypothetical protein
LNSAAGFGKLGFEVSKESGFAVFVRSSPPELNELDSFPFAGFGRQFPLRPCRIFHVKNKFYFHTHSQ